MKNKHTGSLKTWASSLIASTFLFLTPTTDACVQMHLRKIANTNGKITDYQSNADELDVWFNIGRVVRYTWRSNMQKWTQYFLDEGVISLPCYDTEVFWMLVKEEDDFTNDLH